MKDIAFDTGSNDIAFDTGSNVHSHVVKIFKCETIKVDYQTWKIGDVKIITHSLDILRVGS